MKRLNLWLLMSSALMTTSHICCAQAQNIGPSDVCNGGAFSQLTGSNYTCIGDICFSNINTTNKSCFAPTAALTLTGNGYDICFQSITSGTKPCAIEATSGNVTISGFSSFLCTNALNSGAICCCDTSTTARTLSMSGNGTVSFLNNTASSKGGAICANVVSITSAGHTVFSGNSVSTNSGKGGAICIDKGSTTSGSQCTLSAEGGHIIFDGNTVKSSSGAVQRNSLYLGNNDSATHAFKAKEGYGIYFYDPVTCDATSPSGAVNINDTGYTGSIVFSGEKLSAEEAKVAENLKSSLGQAVTLKKGTLVLKDGVTVEAKQVTQSDNTSTLIMDTNTTLQTSSSGEG
ncbi:chlamydia polymorphic membrane middle domain protein, partial [Chlamydia ibidis]